MNKFATAALMATIVSIFINYTSLYTMLVTADYRNKFLAENTITHFYNHLYQWITESGESLLFLYFDRIWLD